MSIISRFVRDDRFAEIDGCPMGSQPAADETACASCPYNVLGPGQPRVGCALSTPFAGYERALQHLAKISGADHTRLVSILEAERRTGERDGLGPAELTALRDIARRWQGLVSNDEAERHLVTAMLRFSEAGLRGEPVRILA